MKQHRKNAFSHKRHVAVAHIRKRISDFRTRTTLTRQLRVLLIGAIAPFIVVMVVALTMLGSLNQQYAVTLQNATTASEFNFNFKTKLDQDMYYYVVKSKNMDHLPLEEVEAAQDVLQRLQKTTTLKDNRWRIKSMLNLCERLSDRMIDIQNTSNYTERADRLENDIHIITGLIDTYMHEYLYDEVYALDTLQHQVTARVNQSRVALVVICILLTLIMLIYAIHIGKGITKPIAQLCEKVKKLGKGDFSVEPMVTHNQEIQTLDDGFNDMVGQINSLLQRVKSDQIALRRGELELLQAQINPHFLYNTFDSIIWLAETHQDELVVQMTTDLSDFFRNSLAKGKDIISLETEKQQVESYLKIQQVRYRDVLDYEIDIPEDLLQYSIPKLTLQPLVENALYHGIKNKRGGGKIEVIARDYGGSIRIKVQDNGAGMAAEQLAALCAGVYEDRHTGLGLVNVHKRLKLYCGENYGLAFESREGIGTVVTVRIPKQNQLSS